MRKQAPMLLALIPAVLLAGCAGMRGDAVRGPVLDVPDQVLGDSRVPPAVDESPQALQRQGETVPSEAGPDNVRVLVRGKPSIRHLSREGWPRLIVRPAPPWVVHGPLYYAAPWGSDGIDVLEPKRIEPRLALALKGDRAHPWSASNVAASVAEPARFLLDTLLLPVRLVQGPPWETAVSPGPLPAHAGPGEGASSHGRTFDKRREDDAPDEG